MTRTPAQDSLFTESILDALRDVVRVVGGPKEAGRLMRPTLSADDAAQWVKDCLNDHRRERFTPQQVMWLIRKGREVGCHSIVNFVCDDGGYTRPSPIGPADEAAQLKRDYIESVRVQKRITERLERLEGEGT